MMRPVGMYLNIVSVGGHMHLDFIYFDIICVADIYFNVHIDMYLNVIHVAPMARVVLSNAPGVTSVVSCGCLLF